MASRSCAISLESKSVAMLLVESEDCKLARDLSMMTRARVAITSQTAVRTKYLPNMGKQHLDQKFEYNDNIPDQKKNAGR